MQQIVIFFQQILFDSNHEIDVKLQFFFQAYI